MQSRRTAGDHLKEVGRLPEKAASCMGDQNAIDARCMVVMFHYVRGANSADDKGKVGPTVDELRAQIEELCRCLEPTDWPSFQRWMRGEGTIPSRSFLLTFDDGLSDHLRHVAPVLAAMRLRGVFFVSGATLSHRSMLPAHAFHLIRAHIGIGVFRQELQQYVRGHAARVPELDSIDPVLGQQMYNYESPELARLKYFLTMVLPSEVRRGVAEYLFARHVGTMAPWAKKWYMSMDDVLALRNQGHTIGGHGWSHDPLTELPVSERNEEFKKSAALLRDLLGDDPRPFSYPYGRHDDEVRRACAAAGFVQGFTTRPAWASLGGDVMEVPRVDTIDVAKFISPEIFAQ